MTTKNLRRDLLEGMVGEMDRDVFFGERIERDEKDSCDFSLCPFARTEHMPHVFICIINCILGNSCEDTSKKSFK